MKLHTRFQLTIEVLSPLHIGSGRELLRDYDYVARGGRTWVIDEEALLEANLAEDGTYDNALLGASSKDLLENVFPGRYDPESPLFRYVMPGEPVNRPISEQIKDVWGNSYIPGSSIKGMLRTILFWGMYTAKQAYPESNKLESRAKFAARTLEGQIFAPRGSRRDTPNMDMLRALNVSDSIATEDVVLHVAAANIYPTPQQQSTGVRIDIEAIRSGTVFIAEVSIKEYGFTNQDAANRLGWHDLRVWLDRIPRLGQAYSQQRLTDEAHFHKDKGPRVAQAFYRQLIDTYSELAKNEWMAQLGWGTSWSSKTLNNLLRDHPDLDFEQDIVRQYRLARGNRRPGDPFPKTRNLIIQQDAPAIPMGWIKCRLDPL